MRWLGLGGLQGQTRRAARGEAREPAVQLLVLLKVVVAGVQAQALGRREAEEAGSERATVLPGEQQTAGRERRQERCLAAGGGAHSAAAGRSAAGVQGPRPAAGTGGAPTSLEVVVVVVGGVVVVGEERSGGRVATGARRAAGDMPCGLVLLLAAGPRIQGCSPPF